MSEDEAGGKPASTQLTEVVARTMEGNLAEVRRLIEALPSTHPRRRLLLSNLRGAVALLRDMPGILTLPTG